MLEPTRWVVQRGVDALAAGLPAKVCANFAHIRIGQNEPVDEHVGRGCLRGRRLVDRGRQLEVASVVDDALLLLVLVRHRRRDARFLERQLVLLDLLLRLHARAAASTQLTPLVQPADPRAGAPNIRLVHLHRVGSGGAGLA